MTTAVQNYIIGTASLYLKQQAGVLPMLLHCFYASNWPGHCAGEVPSGSVNSNNCNRSSTKTPVDLHKLIVAR